ncbi:hypothetical protein [Anatilimnocola floriformis]|uniref:hypothetical protein n=1 Tax=Anatilimnocola floriformis TaxID=2948575 RepID=UPI0020C394DB|nr:hypothetical protein [Anatilimnocola floriformis]
MSTNIAELFLEPIANCLTPEVAQRIVDTRVDPATQAHIDQLARKANSGTLTPSEHAEYAEIVEYIDLVAIFKAKARQRISKQRG